MFSVSYYGFLQPWKLIDTEGTERRVLNQDVAECLCIGNGFQRFDARLHVCARQRLVESTAPVRALQKLASARLPTVVLLN